MICCSVRRSKNNIRKGSPCYGAHALLRMWAATPPTSISRRSIKSCGSTSPSLTRASARRPPWPLKWCSPGRRSGLHRRLDPGPPALQNRPKTLLHPPGGAGGGPGYLKEAPSAFHLLTKKSTRLFASSSRWRSCPPWGFSSPTFSSCSFCCNDRQRNKKRTAPKFGAVLFTFQRSL